MKEKDDKKWTILSSEYLSREPWFTVRRDHVRLPNGNEVPNFYIYEYPDWVCTLAITKDNKFLMVRQYRHGLQQTSIELCAGVCEKEDASPLVSAQRELLEETGYGNGEWSKIMEISANPGTHTNITHCYLAIGVEEISEQQLEPSEDISVCLLSLAELKDLLLKDEIKQAMHTSAIWKYMALNHLI